MIKGKQVQGAYVPQFYGPVGGDKSLEDYLAALDRPMPDGARSGLSQYGRVFVRLAGEVVDETTMLETAQRKGHLDLVRAFSSYERCLWQLGVGSGSSEPTITSGLGFASLVEMAAAVNAAPGQWAWVAAYDWVDPSLIAPQNLFATNRAYLRLLTGRYFRPAGRSSRPTGWPLQAEALNAVYQALFAAPLPPEPWTDDVYGVFWFSQNYRRLYTASRQTAVSLSDSAGRSALNPLTGLPEPAPPEVYNATGDIAYLAVSEDGNSYAVTGKWPKTERRLADGESLVLCMALRSPSGNNAVLVKPLGVTQFTSPGFSDDFELNALAAHSIGGAVSVRRLSGQPQSRGERGPYPMREMFQAALGTVSGFGNDQGKPGVIRFRLRDLTVRGRVSELVPAEVTWYTRARYRPLAAVLRGRP